MRTASEAVSRAAAAVTSTASIVGARVRGTVSTAGETVSKATNAVRATTTRVVQEVRDFVATVSEEMEEAERREATRERVQKRLEKRRRARTAVENDVQVIEDRPVADDARPVEQREVETHTVPVEPTLTEPRVEPRTNSAPATETRGRARRAGAGAAAVPGERFEQGSEQPRSAPRAGPRLRTDRSMGDQLGNRPLFTIVIGGAGAGKTAWKPGMDRAQDDSHGGRAPRTTRAWEARDGRRQRASAPPRRCEHATRAGERAAPHGSCDVPDSARGQQLGHDVAGRRAVNAPALILSGAAGELWRRLGSTVHERAYLTG